jgi:hypothetical protein
MESYVSIEPDKEENIDDIKKLEAGLKPVGKTAKS